VAAGDGVQHAVDKVDKIDEVVTLGQAVHCSEH